MTSYPHKNRIQGFALVVSLTMMVLLTVIAVGLLSLSAITLRQSSTHTAQLEAQANARMALMIAIGELQEALGPDQRISARAEILDTNPDSLEVEGVAHPHYLGVWDSWDTWLTDDRGSLSIQNTYQRGRHPSMFRRWLVSHPNAENTKDMDWALTGGSLSDPVIIVGEGSAGSNIQNHVSVARVGIHENNTLKGNFAWWITDESLKARINLNQRMDSGNINDAQLAAAHTGPMGVGAMTGMAALDTAPDSLRKLITTRQPGISVGNEAAAERFHDMSAHSVGLFTDVRFGGFKSDLNLAFESDVVPEEMRETMLFGDAFDPPIRPMTGSLASITPQNRFIGPMSWRQMREYYRIYRNGFTDSGMRQPLQWQENQPQTRRFLVGKNTPFQWDTMGYARQPVMLRQTWIIATSSQADPSLPGGVDYYIMAIPVITLWNPYNVKLVMDSAEMSYLGSLFYAANLRVKTYRGNQLLVDTTFPDEVSWGNDHRPARNPRHMYWVDARNGKRRPSHDITANQIGFRMNIIENSTGSQPVVFEPGEVRVFSTDEEITTDVNVGHTGGRIFYATPGFTPVEDTNSAALRGLKYRVYPFEGDPPSDPSSITEPLRFSLALRDSVNSGSSTANQFRSPRTSGVVWSFQNTFGMGGNANINDGFTIGEDGSNVDRSWIETHWGANQFWDMAWFGATSVNWVEQDQIPQMGWIVSDQPAERAAWPSPGEPPMPVGMFSIVAKSAERLEYDTLPTAQADFARRDFRNRTWLHAPPTRITNFVMNPTNLERATSSYQLHFRPVNGDLDISQYLEAIGRKAFFGGGYSSASGQTHVAALSLPTTPMVNLASFAGIRMDRGRTREDVPRNGGVQTRIKVTSHHGAAFGVGIGNGYAHPMVSPTGVYTRVDLGRDRFGSNMNLLDDHWDHLFLANEELWDSWFCSGFAPVVSNGSITRSLSDVATDFFEYTNIGNGPISPNFMPHLGGATAEAIAGIVDQPAELPWEKIAAHILHEGQFNVNSTSKEAWKAVLMSLADRPLAVFDGESAPTVHAGGGDEVTIARHTMVGSSGQGGGPGSDDSWRGIRTLTALEIDKLAEEIVRQVKLRGPFLNMSEFVNRRLSNDELGVTGALQAAIDWDEFNAGFNGSTSGSGPSINAAYKSSAAMITAGDIAINYPNPRAAQGSRYAGIPGYVMQSDILQGISSSLSVRGDTFTVRAYGESLAKDGSVAAKAWCEAVVQRVPEYLDARNDPAQRVRDPNATTSDLSILEQVNQEFGRKFRIVSFRWLSAQEV